MFIEIDFNSSEALYIQLRNQIIMGIATSTIREGGYTSVCQAACGKYRYQYAYSK